MIESPKRMLRKRYLELTPKLVAEFKPIDYKLYLFSYTKVNDRLIYYEIGASRRCMLRRRPNVILKDVKIVMQLKTTKEEIT